MKPLLFLVLIFTAGCAVGPVYSPPEMDVSPEWNSEHPNEYEEECLESYKWWESLNDPILNSLIERAVCQNLDLQIAMTRILEARLAYRGAEASLYPRIDGTLSYTYATFNQKTLNNILGSGCCSHSGQRNLNLFEVGFDAEWEIDLFGMRAHQKRSLRALEEASQEDFSNVLVTLTAEVARSYIELRGYQQRLAIINDDIQTQKETLELTKSLAVGGFAGVIDQLQANEQLDMLASQIPQLQFLIQKNIHHLSILLGVMPGDLFCELVEVTALPNLPCYHPIGIPSELLRRRPDIRKAERELASATEEIGTAIAALFPRLSLTGFIGEIATFCSRGSFTGMAGPQILWPILNSRLLEQDVCLNKIKANQALIKYEKTVLEALEEAENAISSFHFELEKSQHLKRVRISSEGAYNLSLQLYQSGLKNYLEVQVVHRSFLNAESSLLQSQIDVLVSYIALYKALGGGWNIFCTPCDSQIED